MTASAGRGPESLSGPEPDPGRPLRLLIADDQAVVRMGFTAMLDSQPDLTVVGTAAEGAEAVRRARELAPDVP